MGTLGIQILGTGKYLPSHTLSMGLGDVTRGGRSGGHSFNSEISFVSVKGALITSTPMDKSRESAIDYCCY
jgi:hypothetical protein